MFGDATIWPAQRGQALYAILFARDKWLGERPQAVNRLLGALVRDEEYIARHESEAKTIGRERLNVDDGYMATSWAQNQFAFTLDQSLVVAMEDEAQWMIQNNLTA